MTNNTYVCLSLSLFRYFFLSLFLSSPHVCATNTKQQPKTKNLTSFQLYLLSMCLSFKKKKTYNNFTVISSLFIIVKYENVPWNLWNCVCACAYNESIKPCQFQAYYGCCVFFYIIITAKIGWSMARSISLTKINRRTIFANFADGYFGNL